MSQTEQFDIYVGPADANESLRKWKIKVHVPVEKKNRKTGPRLLFRNPIVHMHGRFSISCESSLFRKKKKSRIFPNLKAHSVCDAD